MKVTCEKCGTAYDFDDAKITDTGVKVRCTHCEHVFRVKKGPSGDAPRKEGPIPEAPRRDESPPPELPEDKPRRWQIRPPTGGMLEFTEMTTLQRWIVEGRVGREDEISHNGKKWRCLGEIRELETFFVAQERASKPPAPPAPPPAPPPPVSPISVTITQAAPAPAPVAMPPTPVVASPPAATAMASAPAAAIPPRRRSLALPAFAVFILAAAGGTYYLWRSPLDGPWRAWLPPKPPASDPAPAASPAETAPATVAATATSTPPALASTTGAVAVAATTSNPASDVPRPPAVTPSAPPASAPPAATPTAVAAAVGPETLLKQGYEAFTQGRYPEAIAKFKAAVDLAPDSSEGYALLGAVYLESGNEELAESSLETAIRLNPRYADAHRSLGFLYEKRGDKERAIKSLGQFLDLRPDGPQSDDVRRRLEALQGEPP